MLSSGSVPVRLWSQWPWLVTSRCLDICLLTISAHNGPFCTRSISSGRLLKCFYDSHEWFTCFFRSIFLVRAFCQEDMVCMKTFLYCTNTEQILIDPSSLNSLIYLKMIVYEVTLNKILLKQRFLWFETVQHHTFKVPLVHEFMQCLQTPMFFYCQ